MDEEGSTSTGNTADEDDAVLSKLDEVLHAITMLTHRVSLLESAVKSSEISAASQPRVVSKRDAAKIGLRLFWNGMSS